MAAYRCTTCSANWPVSEDNRSCPGCGRDTWQVVSDGPNRTVEEANQARIAYAANQAQEIKDGGLPPATPPSDAYTWRMERFLELGFSEVDSHVLALVRDSAMVGPKIWTFPLHWGKAAKLLEAGATHNQIVSIYA